MGFFAVGSDSKFATPQRTGSPIVFSRLVFLMNPSFFVVFSLVIEYLYCTKRMCFCCCA